MQTINITELRTSIEDKRIKFDELYFSNSEIPLNYANTQKLLLPYAIDLVVTISNKMARYSVEPNSVDINLFDEIKNLTTDELKNIANESCTPGAISIIRCVIAQMFINNEIQSAQELTDTIEKLKLDFINKNIDSFRPYIGELNNDLLNFIVRYAKGSPFRAWGPYYRYLLPFIYDNRLRDSVWHALEVIRDNILTSLHIEDTWESKNSQGWYNKVRSYFGFEGPSNYGSQRAVLMLHPNNIPDHKNAFQLVCYFYEGNIWAGCDIGVNIDRKKYNLQMDNWERIDKFDFNNCCGIIPNYPKISQSFSNILSVLNNNLDFAQINNDKLLQLQPAIGTQEIAEGNAEQSGEDDANLYDSFDEVNTTDDNISLESKPPAIKDAQIKKEKKLYPNIKPEEDFLGRKKIAEYIVDQLIKNKKVEPLNIGIYADWGSGKTQIFNFIKKILPPQSSKPSSSTNSETYICESIDFDAWQYDDQEHIWAALIMELMNQCKKHFSFYYCYIFHKCVLYIKRHWQEIILKYLVILLTFIFVLIVNQYLKIDIITKIDNFNFGLKFIGILLITILPDLFKLGFVNIDKVFVKCFKTPTYHEQLGFRDEINELTSYALDYLSNKGNKRIVLFIDNLDRCSSSNIKQVLDSICQFLEMCNNQKTNLITIFAMDKSIIENALKKEAIPDEKVNEYLEKIINLPIYLKKPKEINSLINRFFGEEQNQVKDFLKQKYALTPYNPRTLANIRYLEHMVYNVYGEILQKSNSYIDLFKLQKDQGGFWEKLTDSEINQKLEKDIEETNIFSTNKNLMSLQEYQIIARKTISYLEKFYNCHIEADIKYFDKTRSKYIMADGIIALQTKDILFEIKCLQNQQSAEQILNNTLKQFINRLTSFETNKILEFILVMVIGKINNKEKLVSDLNKEMQNYLLQTNFSGYVMVLSPDELN